jgi:hypothetical protein
VGLDRQASGPPIVWTDMSANRTVFFDPVAREYFEFETRTTVARSAAPGAGGPYSGFFTYCQYPDSDEYGTAKWRTTDTRLRWVHGGGTGLEDPLAPRQGWKPTLGCTRAQNEDVEEMCRRSKRWLEKNPNKRIPYSRW